MDVNTKLDWKQVIGAVIALYLFGQFFTPIQMYVLKHPLVGIAILAALLVGWWGYRRFKKKPALQA